jgi:hypothetical protein
MQEEDDAGRTWQDQPDAVTAKLLSNVGEAAKEHGEPECRARGAARRDPAPGHARVVGRPERTTRSVFTAAPPGRRGLGLNGART